MIIIYKIRSNPAEWGASYRYRSIKETQKMEKENAEKAKSKVIDDMNKEQASFMKEGEEKPKGEDKKIWSDKPK
jgi:hypothetical protein